MPEKIKNNKNRLRSKTVGFRVSPEEWDVFSEKVKICGYSIKQEYILECLMDHKITAKGNPLMLTQFRIALRRMQDELERINNVTELTEAIDKELFEPITTMLQILEAFKENEK